MTTNEHQKYNIGYSKQFVAQLSLRGADREASSVVPYIRPDTRLLDIGCGPGSITCDFAALTSGQVVGVDKNPAQVEIAKTVASERKLSNTTFIQGDVLEGLPYESASFDIVFASNVLVHLSDPTTALKEMKRLVRPGGIVATRDSCSVNFFPSTKHLDDIQTYFWAAFMVSPGTGWPWRRILPYLQEAGFEMDKISIKDCGHPHFSEEGKATAYNEVAPIIGQGGSFREIITGSGVKGEDLDQTLRDIKTWQAEPGSWYSNVNREVIYKA